MSPFLDSIFALGSAAQGSSPTHFGDPFMTPSWNAAPRDLTSLMDVCRLIWFRSPEYRMAAWRTIAHFTGDIDFVGSQSGDKKERNNFRDYLREQLGLNTHQQESGADWACYGNGFSRIYFPFNRFLLVPTDNGNAELSVDQVQIEKYDSVNVKYVIQDPTRQHLNAKQRRVISVDFVDRRALDMNRISLCQIDPALVYIQFAERNRQVRIAERFRPELITSVKAGELWNVNTTPLEQLRAISKEMDYLYNAGEVFHMRAPCISGVSNGGWGVPEILANYGNIHQLQVVRKTDESIGLDYVLPMRVVYPDIQNNSNLTGYANAPDMQMYAAEMKDMLRRRRDDPFLIQGLPFRVGYQEISGNGRQFLSKDIHEWHVHAMLNGAGFPAEVYTGSMNVQTIPVALRLFENTWQWFSRMLNLQLKWVTQNILDYMGMEPMQVRLAPPSIARDEGRRQIMLQLAAGGEFSRATALRELGVDNPVEEIIERRIEDMEAQRAIAKIEQDYAMRDATLAGAGQGVDGAPGGQSYNPSQQGERALEEAKKMLQIQFDGDRQKALAALKSTDPDLYALVTAKMKELRATAASEGRKQVAQLAQA